MTAFGSFWMPLSEFACQRKFYNKIHTQDILLGYLSVTMVQNGEFGHPVFISWLRPAENRFHLKISTQILKQ